MTRSDSLTKLIPAILAARAAMPAVLKDADNPHFKSHYVSLEGAIATCEPTLREHGLAVLQSTSIGETGWVLHTVLAHTSGEWIGSAYPLLCDPARPQAMGGALTYARRYSYLTILGVAAEDDDGEAASGRGSVTTAPRQESAAREKPRQDWGPRARGGAEKTPTRPAPAAAPTVHGSQQYTTDFYRWIKQVEETHGPGLLAHVEDFGRAHGYPRKILIWSGVMIQQAYADALAAIKRIYGPEAMEPEEQSQEEPEGDPQLGPGARYIDTAREGT